MGTFHTSHGVKIIYIYITHATLSCLYNGGSLYKSFKIFIELITPRGEGLEAFEDL